MKKIVASWLVLFVFVVSANKGMAENEREKGQPRGICQFTLKQVALSIALIGAVLGTGRKGYDAFVVPGKVWAIEQPKINQAFVLRDVDFNTLTEKERESSFPLLFHLFRHKLIDKPTFGILRFYAGQPRFRDVASGLQWDSQEAFLTSLHINSNFLGDYQPYSWEALRAREQLAALVGAVLEETYQKHASNRKDKYTGEMLVKDFATDAGGPEFTVPIRVGGH
jgi:hypothetical protein